MKPKKTIKKYVIRVIGCHDSTQIEIDLDVHEFRLVSAIAGLITATSNSECEPTMVVKEV